MMSRLNLYDPSMSRNEILVEREKRFMDRSVKDKLYQLLKLINLSVKMNGGKPLKTPEGKGIVISKPIL